MNISLENLSYPAVELYLQQADRLIIPIGSLEQHSPQGILGTDFLIARGLSLAVGEKSHTLVAPALSYGIAPHHLGFAGTVSLRPTTLIAMIEDLLQSFHRHGFRQFFFINGHGGNIPTIQAAFSQLSLNLRFKAEIISWWHLPEIKNLENDLFGPENGFHATVSEISVSYYLAKCAGLAQNDMFLPYQGDYDSKMPNMAWPLNAQAFKEYFPLGSMGSNPKAANAEQGKLIFDKAVSILTDMLTAFSQKTY